MRNLTLTNLLDTYADETKDSTSANRTRGARYIGDHHLSLAAFKLHDYRSKTATITSVAGSNTYNLPLDCDKVKNVYIVVSSTKYPQVEVPSETDWDHITARLTTNGSQYAGLYFIRNGKIEFSDKFPDTNSTITINYLVHAYELTKEDYTTGTLSINNGSATVTGSGTTWNTANINLAAAMIKLGTEWYDISSIDSTTQITISRNYEGTNLSGSTYTIGDVPIIQPAYQRLLWLGACADYYNRKESNTTSYYQNEYTKLRAELEAMAVKKTAGSVWTRYNNQRIDWNEYSLRPTA